MISDINFGGRRLSKFVPEVPKIFGGTIPLKICFHTIFEALKRFRKIIVYTDWPKYTQLHIFCKCLVENYIYLFSPELRRS